MEVISIARVDQEVSVLRRGVKVGRGQELQMKRREVKLGHGARVERSTAKVGREVEA